MIDSSKIKLFEKEVLKGILPNMRWMSVGGLAPASATILNSLNYTPSESKGIYKGSDYDYKGSYKFIHYTSIQNLISILRDKQIRMYNLGSMDDRDEFSFAFNHTGLKENHYSGEAKNKLFVLSMCNYEVEETEQSFNIWRQYGLNGDGCGIVFKFKKTFSENWLNFILSSVHYGENSIVEIVECIMRYYAFKKKENFEIRNFERLLYNLLPLHKRSIYKDELEVRLLFDAGVNRVNKTNNNKINIDVNRRGKASSFINLELEKSFSAEFLNQFDQRERSLLLKLYPYIEIDKIIFGYRVAQSAEQEIVQAVFKIIKQKEYKKIPQFLRSPLKSYF
jgi:hypothetical protein